MQFKSSEKFFNLINRINLDYKLIPSFKNPKIKKDVYEIEPFLFNLEIQVDDFIDIKELEIFISALKTWDKYKFVLKFNVINNENLTIKLLIDYIKFISINFKKDFSINIFSNFDFADLILDSNKLKFKIWLNNNSDFKILKSQFQILNEKLSYYGFKDLEFIFIMHKPKLNVILTKASTTLKNNANNTNSNNKYFYKNKDVVKIYKLKELFNTELPNKYLINFNAKIFDIIFKQTKYKNGYFLYIYFTDYSDSVLSKIYLSNTNYELLKNDIDFFNNLKVNNWFNVNGVWEYDDFLKKRIINFTSKNLKKNITKIVSQDIMTVDSYKEKRVELHIHSKMSTMDGISSISDYIKRAVDFGHKAIAITDLNNIQAFPEAQIALKKYEDKIKLIYGSELNIIKRKVFYVKNPKNQLLKNAKYVFFDLETTGLSCEDDEIIEFGAVILNGINNPGLKRVDILIKASKPLTTFTKELTGINDKMLENEGIDIKEALLKIADIFSEAILVAHNANFDIGFINSWFKKYGIKIPNNTIIDTLPLARVIWPYLKNHKLGHLAKVLKIDYDSIKAHRGDYDALILKDIYLVILNNLSPFLNNDDGKKQFIESDLDLEKINCSKIYNRSIPHHVTVLAKNKKGLKTLFKLISYSHIEGFFKSPKIFKDILSKNRTDILIGSAGCEFSEVFEIAKNKNREQLKKVISFFDYIEVQPPQNYIHLIEKNGTTLEEIKIIIKKIIAVALELNKIIVASSDARYLSKKEQIFHKVYINSKRINGIRHPLYSYKKQIKNYPFYTFKTTNELLLDFAFLNDQDLIYNIVIKNTNKIANLIKQLYPVKDKLYSPSIKDADKQLKIICYKNAKLKYGNNLPKIVEERLEKELNSIISHGFAVIYLISHKLVEKSIKDGYLVGSRGSVGSSFVATMSNITEVNPLPPHYLCLKCNYSNFDIDLSLIKSGYDLKPIACPNCKKTIFGEGHNIPFETFLGFKGDKVPDIDLNFSGDYQSTAHNYAKVLFGESYVYRAGTISTVAEKTAVGYVKTYLEENNISSSFEEVKRIAKGCEGVKRTTGQHPGGIVVIPKEFDVYDFTPINYPADDINSSWKTTHFDFHAIHDNVLKLDILGHVDPTALKLLEKMTNVNPKLIPNYDLDVLSLFSSSKIMNLENSEELNETTGAIGLPEFGTKFVRKMLKLTKPKSFSDLVKISGLSHGTNVWLDNAADLIKNNITTLSEVIGCRDDIMVYLISKGIDNLTSFRIMEKIRKGQGLLLNEEKKLIDNKVPNWYIESCKKIKYIFPKAHATAYVLMAWRIAWFKINYPYEYYATFFSTRISVFDIETIISGKSAILKKIKLINKKMANEKTKFQVTKKEKDLLIIYEVALEMWNRGIKMVSINLKYSKLDKFYVNTINQEKVIVPPFTALNGLGVAVSQNIINERNKRKDQSFLSIDDFKKTTSVNKTLIMLLKKIGSFNNLPENDQFTIFDLL